MLHVVASHSVARGGGEARGALTPAALPHVARMRRSSQAQRTDVIKLQGEYRAQLHSLEQQLLAELSSLEGNILDNDGIMHALEKVIPSDPIPSDPIRSHPIPSDPI